MFPPGTLWRKILQTTEQALENGSLRPIPTEFELVPDGGIQFLVRIVSNLARKQQPPAPVHTASGPPQNPFLPYDPSLYVADASPSHVCLLNKFNVVEHHLLIVTRQFEPQEAPLGQDDFSALWTCMAEYEGLGFYNGGRVAGASQPHKHLQMVPLPLAPHGPAVPIEPLIEDGEPGQPGRCRRLPFPHAFVRWDASQPRSPADAARMTLTLYLAMMRSIGRPADGAKTGPYNLLLTRRWMLLVPRSRETFQSNSLNALALAGALLVRDRSQLTRLKQSGPMAALTHATRNEISSD